jgi:hypothetical protein
MVASIPRGCGRNMDRRDAFSPQRIQFIKAQLNTGERLCWVGRESRRRYRAGRVLRIALFCVWFALAGFLSAVAIAANPDFLRDSFSEALPVIIPLILAALGGLMLGREIFFPRKREPDLYALTNQRAMVIVAGHAVKVWNYGAQAARSIQVRRHRRGAGDIIFERRAQWGTDAEGRATRSIDVIGFFDVPSVDDVLSCLAQIDKNMAE